MGTTLSHGFYQPAQGDTGDVWFPAMANNMLLLNNHTHNGTDAALLAVQTISILAANWGAPTNGTYSQTITMPTVNGVQTSYDTSKLEFRLSTGQAIYPSVVRVSSTQFTVTTIDNTQTYTVIFR
jgi:hypothetical protein